MDLTFLLSFAFVLIALLYSFKQKLDLEKEILYSSFRAFLQLMLLGFLLIYIFDLKNLFYISLVLLFMILFASYTAQKRVKLEVNGFKIAFFSLFFSFLPVFGFLLLSGIIKPSANEMIPIAGMIIGNSLNVYNLAIDRFKSDVKKELPIIEGKLSLGLDLKTSLHSNIKNSIKASLIPIINNLQTVGIVLIPGVTVGLLLGGAEPLTAISYQLVIMYMILAISLFTSFFAMIFVYKSIIFEIQ